MVIAMFGGWSGRPVAAPFSSPAVPLLPERHPLGEITAALRHGLGGTIVLTVASPEVSVRKTVYADGRSAAEITRASERLTLTAGDLTLTVLSAHRAAVVNVNTASEDDLIRFRGPLVASAAVRSFRSLVAAVEEMREQGLEHLSVLLTGALVAQYDGDAGAIARLCRGLRASYASRSGRGRPAAASPARAAFRRQVLRAACQLESSYESYSCWNPARQGCAFSWLAQVESAWHACVRAEPNLLPKEASASLTGSRAGTPAYMWPR